MSMSADDTETRERGPYQKRETLWVTDAELIRRMGIPEHTARALLHEYDAKRSGFPQKQRLMGDRRYWPAVVAYFDQLYGLKITASHGRQRHD